MNLRVEYIYISLQGKKEINEDYLYVGKDKGIFIVADGCTGLNGQIASRTAVEKVSGKLNQIITASSYMDDERFEQQIAGIIRGVNKDMFRIYDGKTCTTLDVVVMGEEKFHYAHVGDGRIYVLTNDDELKQITDDDSCPRQSSKRQLSEEQVKVYPKELINAIGTEEISIKTGNYLLSDIKRILMTTDGLSDVAIDDEIRAVLKEYDMKRTSSGLISLIKSPEKVAELYLQHRPDIIIDSIKHISEDYSENPHIRELNERLHKANSDAEIIELIHDSCEKHSDVREIYLSKVTGILRGRDNATFILIEPSEEKKEDKRPESEKKVKSLKDISTKR